MARHVLVVTLLGALAAAGALALTPAEPAAGCRVLPTTLEEKAAGAKMVVVGEVIDERPMVLSSEQAQYAGYEPYESTVTVVAALKGDPERQVTL